MGKYSDELARIVATPHYGTGHDSAAFSTVLDGLGQTLANVASDPGMSGSAADAASEMFVQQARRSRNNADAHAAVANVVAAANDALDRARTASAGLPPGGMSRNDFSAVCRRRLGITGAVWCLPRAYRGEVCECCTRLQPRAVRPAHRGHPPVGACFASKATRHPHRALEGTKWSPPTGDPHLPLRS